MQAPAPPSTGGSNFASTTLLCNAAPTLGSCAYKCSGCAKKQTDPYAFETEISYKCKDWDDSNLPLSYEFSISNIGGGAVIIQPAGSSPDLFVVIQAIGTVTLKVQLSTLGWRKNYDSSLFCCAGGYLRCFGSLH